MPELYERFPVYDCNGFQVGFAVRKLNMIGVTVCPMDHVHPEQQLADVRAHIDLMTEQRMEQL